MKEVLKVERPFRSSALRHYAPLAIVSTLCAAAVLWLLGKEHGLALLPAVQPLSTNLPADEVFRSFRVSLAEEKPDEFEHWVTQICDRKLLAGLSRAEIRVLLGQPMTHSWTYLDKTVADSMNPVRWLVAKKADYWGCSIFVKPGDQLVFGLEFDGEQLIRSNYGRGDPDREPPSVHFETQWHEPGR